MLPGLRHAALAAQTQLQLGLGGSRVRSQAAGGRRIRVSVAKRLWAARGCGHLNPSPTSRNAPAAPRSGGVPGYKQGCRQPQLRSATPVPPCPSLPAPSQAVTRGWVARLGPRWALQPRARGRGRVRYTAGPGTQVASIPRRGCGPHPEIPSSKNLAFSTLSPPFEAREVGVGISSFGMWSPPNPSTLGTPISSHLPLRLFNIFCLFVCLFCFVLFTN